MNVNEWRTKYPQCRYCSHSRPAPGGSYCEARKFYPASWAAKRCPLYTPEEYPRKLPEPPNIGTSIVVNK
jgi:hypothetical protein